MIGRNVRVGDKVSWETTDEEGDVYFNSGIVIESLRTTPDYIWDRVRVVKDGIGPRNRWCILQMEELLLTVIGSLSREELLTHDCPQVRAVGVKSYE